MDNKIPYKLFSKNKNSENSFFLHGNGFPPESYKTFLKELSNHLNIYAMCQKPFWKTEINPKTIIGWEIFKKDAVDFLNQNNLNNSIGIGHSMGAVIILLIELENPGTFKKIFLLDPVITSPLKSLIYKVLLKANLVDKFHPMIQRTNKKKIKYSNKKELYQSYRQKKIFSKLSNQALNDYIESIIKNNDKGIKIKLSKEWENTIYRNGSIHDYWIWTNITNIKIPAYVITPYNNEFGHFNYGKNLACKNKYFSNLTINETTHLFPLEKPNKTAELITSNINKF